jgi:aldehyde dehydrogenase (NAD+)
MKQGHEISPHVDDNFIDGGWAVSAAIERIEVIDPATEEVWGSVPASSAADLDAAVLAAHRAFLGWKTTTPSERAEALLRMATEIESRSDVLSTINSHENGSPVAETSRAADNAGSILRYFASLAPHLERHDVRPFLDGSGETLVSYDPLGVCAIIAPWNFPINLVMVKVAPALLAGCTVVIKPASPTPLSIRIIAESAAAAGIPPGVLNVVTGNGALGDLLVRHPLVSKVAFTGSTEVGRRIAAACGELLRPVTLELGGKSSAIVLPDADLTAMSDVLIRSCMRNTGQTCYISTRILAPAARYDAVVDMVTSTIAAGKQGDPFDRDTVFGPSATRAQRDTVIEFIRSGVHAGARATTGGDVPSGFRRGFYVKPTVFADVTPDMAIAREEIFGPVITVLRYDQVHDAVDLANNTQFGLGGIVFGADHAEAVAVARQVDSGSVGINFFASNHQAPFGGRKDSGLGVEYGVEGLHAYLSPQSIHMR